MLYDFLAEFAAGPAFEDSDFEFWPDFGGPGDCAPEFDEFSKIVALESSDTEVVDVVIPVVEAALVVLLSVFFLFALGMGHILFELDHVLGEGLVEDRFELVVLPEDQARQLIIVMEQV